MSKYKIYHNVKRKSNHNFLDQIREEQAYFLGLIEADGYLSKKGNSITYSVKEQDYSHIVKVHKILETDVKIGRATSKASSKSSKLFTKFRFTITSYRIYTKLIKFGCRSGELPKIPKKYLPHWLRGLFDGDGSVFLEQRTKTIKSNLTFGDLNLAKEVKKYLNKLGIKCGNVHTKTNSKNCWYVNLGPNMTRKLKDLMYQDATIFLDRKYRKFKGE